ncbi:hypothetical protein [Marinilabilia rubra]|uniref:Outer membrane protein beta-barrel domain-containing protein n=1 Tax=Marinilabilia rubra TaxID=2162893 RepID=A0A2U2B8Y1_9BACT|nr:hypothetical protein [Marinilabilia rubra]PWD99520.1 hypothetical protein DDZ16_10990 [Marinilabilia rubra]
MRKCFSLIVLAVIILSGQVAAQNFSGELNKMGSSMRKNLGKYNVLAGVNTMSLTFDDGQGRINKPIFGNAYGYYIGGSSYKIISENDQSFWSSSTQFIFGKQTINSPSSSPSLIQDSLSIFNFSGYSGYFFKAPLRLTYNRKLDKNISWGISAGAVLKVPMMYGTISNGDKTEDLTSVYGQYLFDYGWTVGFELGFRSAFVACDFSQGISNMSDSGGDTSISDNGSIALTVGLRLGTPKGKEDAKLINSLQKKLTKK